MPLFINPDGSPACCLRRGAATPGPLPVPDPKAMAIQQDGRLASAKKQLDTGPSEDHRQVHV